eukprot:Rhum_TRINITY_DN14766_c7_g1::Rhum_TRINITY_DN14766_c7_g1_i1::g.115027::m.115027
MSRVVSGDGCHLVTLCWDDEDAPGCSGGGGGGGRGAAASDDADTPRDLSEPADMFADMARRAKARLPAEVEKLRQEAAQRRVPSVGTVCTGVDTPVLALDMLSEALGVEVAQHVFSCETEPRQRAFAVRGTTRHPGSLLFKHVEDLGLRRGRTAFGNTVCVPDVDVLVVNTGAEGFALEDETTRGWRVFNSALRYAARHAPSVVVVDNVAHAAWEDVARRFTTLAAAGGFGYKVTAVATSASSFYLPQKRDRLYFVASRVERRRGASSSNSVASNAAARRRFCHALFVLSRAATRNLESFLLPDASPAVQAGLRDPPRLRPNGGVDLRADSGKDRVLGRQRPYTRWSEEGRVDPPRGTAEAAAWLQRQPDLVKDTIDAAFLERAYAGADDRYCSTAYNAGGCRAGDALAMRTGRSACVAPGWLPFVPSRGRPLCGQECLALQGVPTRSFDLRGCPEPLLREVAGNAMPTTVIGAVALSALLTLCDTRGVPRARSAASTHALPSPMQSPMRSPQPLTPTHEPATPAAPASDASPSFAADSSFGAAVEEADEEEPLDLSAAPPPREGGVLAGGAAPAVPACACGAAAASRCAGCLLERCSACLLRGSNPRHEFAPLSEAEAGRVPQPTRKELLASLPTCVAFEMDVPAAAAAAGDGVGEEDAEAAARRAHHARIRGLLQGRPVVLEDVSLRGAEWTAVYGCKAGDVCVRLVFSVGGHAEWRVFLPAVLPSDGRREHHGSPTVVVDCRTGALRVAEPSPAVVALEIRGTDGGDSWEAGLGLNVDGLRRAAAQHPTTLTVRPAALTRVGPAAAAARALDVSGTYRRLEGCGGVRGVLYKRVGEGGGVAEARAGAAAAAPRDMFFFLDPSCAGVEAEDAFCVFAPALGGGRCSQRVAAEHGFFPRVRPEQAFHVRCTRLEYAPAVGRVVADADVGVVWHSSGSSSNSDAATLLDITSDACRRPVVLARCSLPVCGAAPADAAFEHLPVAERGWHEFGTHQATAPVAQCSRCVPTAPLGVDFSSVGSVAELAFAVEASVPTAYIEALGHRPRGLHVVQRLGAGGGAELSLVANPAALAHRLLSGRPTARRCTWSFGRVDEGVRVAAAAKGLRSALNRGCEKEAPAVQPAGFSGTLREDQLRVLAWMLKRETAGTWYDTYGEEETLGDLVLRVVVQETVTRMGGVLAHEPGYGKTALVLALVAGDDGDGGMATLVVAPTRTLAQQWGAEARACTSGRPVVVALGTSEATAATAEAAAAAQANGAGGFVVVDHAALASSAWALRVQWRRLVVDEHEQSGMAASVRERLISVAERAGSTWLLSSAANLTSLPAVLRAAALLRVRVGDETWTTDPQSFRAGSCAASFVWRYVRRSVCAAPATAAASAASVATTAVLGSVDSVTTRQQRRVCRRLRHTSGQGDGDVALQVRAAAGLLPDGEPLEDEEAKLDAQLAALLDSLEGDATKAYQRRAEARREFSDRAFECRLNLWPSVARSSDADVRAAVDAVIRSATTLAATASPPRKRSRRGTPEQVEEQLGKMGAELSRTAAVVTDTVRALRYLRHSRADGCRVCEEDAGGEGTGLMVSVACGHVAHARHFEQRMRTPASLCPVAGCAAVVNPSLLHVVEDNADDESHGSGDGNSVTRSKLEDACSLVERLCATASVPGGSSPRVVVYGQDVVVLQAFEERLNERNLTVASSLQRVTTRVGGNFLARAKNTDVLLARLGDLDGVRLAPFVAVVFLHPVFAEPGAPAGSAAAMEQRAIAQVHAEEGVALQVFRCVAKGTIDDELMASLLAE